MTEQLVNMEDQAARLRQYERMQRLKKKIYPNEKGALGNSVGVKLTEHMRGITHVLDVSVVTSIGISPAMQYMEDPEGIMDMEVQLKLRDIRDALCEAFGPPGGYVHVEQYHEALRHAETFGRSMPVRKEENENGTN